MQDSTVRLTKFYVDSILAASGPSEKYNGTVYDRSDDSVEVEQVNCGKSQYTEAYEQ
jgi:hypothetical protein